MPDHNTDPDSAPAPLVAVMSSGFFGFFAHAGFLAGLADLGLEPDAYAGSSSGALVAALAAGGASPAQMLEGFCQLTKDDFWDPLPPWRFIKYLLRGFRGMSGYIQGEAFGNILERTLPALTFEECQRPLLISALDPDRAQRVVFTQGPLIPAVRASGAVPMLFMPVKHQGRTLLDGGLVDKAPLLAAARHFKPGSLAVHLLPSSSLEKPAGAYLRRKASPVALFYRAVDAARQQNYQDQAAQARREGVRVLEVVSNELPRLGPDRLHLGPQAFDQARGQTVESLQRQGAGLARPLT